MPDPLPSLHDTNSPINIVLFGIGNNEDKYLKTKHNIGRLVIEALALRQNSSFQKQGNKNLPVLKAKIEIVGKNLDKIAYHTLYSSSYVNDSGRFLQSYLSYNKIDINSSILIILQDDSDQNEGEYKVVIGGGSAGHNGISDIYKYINKDKVIRIKVGIRPFNNLEKSMTFVLKPITKLDSDNIISVTNYIIKALDTINNLSFNNYKLDNITTVSKSILNSYSIEKNLKKNLNK